MTFSDLAISSSLISALDILNIKTPTEVQKESIPVILSGKDSIAISQTGSGKTLAYLLPILTLMESKNESRALVLTPTKETADQIFRVANQICKDLPITISIAATGSPVALQAKELKKNPRLIIATPGRLHEHLQSNKLLLKGLDLLVLDEADRMLDLGFESQLRFIQGTLRGERQTLFFAANYGPWVESVSHLLMKPDPFVFRSEQVGKPVQSLTQKVYFMKAGQKENKLIDEVKKFKGGTIIFADSQESCVAIGRLLAHHGFSSEFVHGKMNPGHRNRILREFREQKIQILVTTDMLARGLDIPTIDLVINFDLPYKGEEFLHRIGRTARAGRDGMAITFVIPSDGRTFRKMKKFLEGATEEKLTRDFTFVDRD